MVEANDGDAICAEGGGLCGVTRLPFGIVMRRAVDVNERGVFARVAEVGARAELLVVMLSALRQSEVVLFEESQGTDVRDRNRKDASIARDAQRVGSRRAKAPSYPP